MSYAPVPENIADRVKAGIAFLDAKHPGWAAKVDLNQPDRRSILGHLAKPLGEQAIMDLLWPRDNKEGPFSAERHGFTIAMPGEWPALHDEWMKQIAAIQSK